MEDDTCRAMVVVQKKSSLIRSSCSSTSPSIQTTQDDQKIEIDTYIQSRYDMISSLQGFHHMIAFKYSLFGCF